MDFKKFLLLTMALTGTAAADTLQPLGDEFENAGSQAAWRLLSQTEGWQASQLELWDMNTSRLGFMRLIPYTSSWYGELRGVLVYKDITGDFVATARLRVRSRHNAANPLEPPNRFFSLAGIFARGVRPVISGAPSPYTTTAVWPPAAHGSDWTTGGENYIFLSHGTAGNPGTRQYEIKSTRNSTSHLYFSSQGVPQGSTEAATEIWLQMVRVGGTVVCLRKHSAGGAWIVENRYPNPDHPFPAWGASLQVGITTYTDWDSIGGAYWIDGNLPLSQQRSFHHNYTQLQTGTNAYGGVPHLPDIVCDVDYLHFQRPDAAVTEAALQALAISYQPAGSTQPYRANPPIVLTNLPAAGIGALLGDAADVPLGTVSLVDANPVTEERTGSAALAVRRSGGATNHPVSVSWHLANGSANAPADFPMASGSLTWPAGDTADRQIIFSLTKDQLAEGPEAYFLRLSGLDGPAAFATGEAEISAAVTLLDHPVDQWRLSRFGAAANSPGHGATDDPDRDGLATLLEYAVGTDPATANSLPWQIFSTPTQHEIRFTPALATPGASLRFESSSDLVLWSPRAGRAAGAASWVPENGGTASVNGDTGEVTVIIPVSGPRQFVRLQVEME